MFHNDKTCAQYLKLVISLALNGIVECEAASDGTVGATSSGSANITLEIPRLVRISNMKDLPLPAYTGSGGLTSSSTFTIANNYNGAYRINAKGDGPNNIFALKNGSSQIPYQLLFSDTENGAMKALESGTTLAGNTGAIHRLNTSEQNAKYQVKILENDLHDAVEGRYQGILIINISPE